MLLGWKFWGLNDVFCCRFSAVCCLFELSVLDTFLGFVITSPKNTRTDRFINC